MMLIDKIKARYWDKVVRMEKQYSSNKMLGKNVRNFVHKVDLPKRKYEPKKIIIFTIQNEKR